MEIELFAGLLIIRLFLGLTLIGFSIFHIVNMEEFVRNFQESGWKSPRGQATLFAVGELTAGMLLALGLMTGVALWILTMLAVTVLADAHLRNRFMIAGPVAGCAAFLGLGAAICGLAVFGAGLLSLDFYLVLLPFSSLGIANPVQPFGGGWVFVGGGLAAGVVHLLLFWRPSAAS